MKNFLKKELIEYCDECQKDTAHVRSAYWLHIVVSIIIGFWLIFWSFIKTKSTCISCGEEVESNSHFKIIWLMIFISFVIISSIGSGIGAMDDLENAAKSLEISLNNEDILTRGVNAFTYHATFKSVLLVFFLFILVFRSKIMKHKISDMVWFTRLVVIMLAVSGVLVVVFRAVV